MGGCDDVVYRVGYMPMISTTATPTLPIAFNKLLLWAIATGFLIGFATLGLQAILPSPFNQLANSAATWVIIAFVLGRFATSWQKAILVGIVALAGEVLGYYTLAYFMELVGLSLYSFLIIGMWLLMAVVGGTVFGVGGYVAFHTSGLPHTLGRATLGAIFLAEGLYYGTALGYLSTAIGWFVLAAVITYFLARNTPNPRNFWLMSIGLGIVMFGGLQLLVLLDDFRANLQ
jgi:hypothetical protein